MREIYVIHLQRSGGHAISNWLLKLIAAPTQYVNDLCSDATRDRCKEHGKLVVPGDTEWILFGIEDTPIHAITDQLRRVAPFIPVLRDSDPLYILVLRDIYNMLASRWKYHMNGRGCKMGACTSSVVTAWKQYAKTAFCIQHGAGHRLTLQQMLVVDFDRWAVNPAYRKSLWTALAIRDDGIPGSFDPEASEEVSTWNNGSAFDGVPAKASAMEINARYKQVPSVVFSAVTEDAATWNQALFGWRLDE